MDPGKIVSLKLTLEQIREAAEEFREEHVFNSSLPVDTEHVIEATMGINEYFEACCEGPK